MSTAAEAIPAETIPERPQRLSALRELRALLPYLARYKPQLALGFCFLLIHNLAGALWPLAVGAIVDAIAGGRAYLEKLTFLPAGLYGLLLEFYRPLSRDTIAFYGMALLALILIKGFFSYWTRWILIGISRDIEYDLRNDVLDRLLRLEPAFYIRNRTGELMSRATNDLNAVRMVLGPGIMYTGNTLVVLAAAVALMLTLSPLLTLLALLPVPLVAFSVRYFGERIHQRFEKVQALLAAISARVQENLAGVRVLRAYNQEEPETRAFENQNRDFIARNLELIRTWSVFYPALEALIGLTFLIVLWQGGRLVLSGAISLGALIAFYTYMGQLVWPMIALGWVTNIFQRGAASMGRLNYILQARPGIDDAAARPGRAEEIRGEIEFRNLTFTYPGNENGRPVLRDICLRIPAGSTVALVGPTGSGKSTLAALVARLWDAPYGCVLLDGRPLPEWPLAELRRAIGFVPQEAFLFSDTLRENIALGVENPPPGAVEQAAELAGLSADVADFPSGLDTVVGERGITLSGGQKQRATLARALLRNPKILILDDALSSVDTETEERILQNLTGVLRQRTTILISHRCSTVRQADQIVVLRDGSIVEQGSHDELIARGGYYAELYQKQLLEEELERA
ncbi:MAG: ABC transporter ATP-binding protein/permease [Acidobacteriia bacterium]|jgi:ATP-binding cassette subfamily B protein|nr:ABC transporter ATP-binding protein/permease [Terriglobia bacterium]